MNSDAGKEAIKESVTDALKEKLGDAEGGTTVTVDKVEVDGSNGNLVVEGSVTGPKKAFMDGDQSPSDVPADGTIDLSAGGLGGADALADVVKKALGDELAEQQEEQFEREADAAKVGCLGDCGPAFDAGEILARMPGADAEKVVQAVIDADCGNKTTCIEDVIAAAAPGSTADVQEALANALAAVEVDDEAINEPASPINALLQLAAIEDQKAAAADLRAASDLPAETEMTAPPIVLGEGLGRPSDDYGLIVSPPNSGEFARQITEQLEGFGPIDTILPDMGFELVTIDLPSRRRDVLVEEILVMFKYTTLCTKAQVADGDCGFKKGDADYIAIQGLLDNILNSFVVAPPPCASFETGFDAACLAQAAVDAYTAAKNAGKSDDEAAAAANAAVKALVECGFLGRNPATGECVEEDAAALDEVDGLTADAAAAYQKANPPTTEGPEGQKSAGSIIPIAAGAAAGLLIIIIIIVVVVVMRGRNTDEREPVDKTPVRSVVAFENPMYDDPGQSAEPTYDAGLQGDEGLYDEPAFTATAQDRNNPMYQSSEDLAEEAEESGYLDVAPDEEE